MATTLKPELETAAQPGPADPASEPMPAAFLEVRVKRLDLSPPLVGLCAGYEDGRWRGREFARHMMEWLPEFALNYTERKSLSASTAVALMRAAARRVYTTDKFKNRGEFGELLLHIAVRQVFNTLPAISKIYYKDADNDTVKGFDAVHVLAHKDSLELWLGEAKFYDDIARAIADVVEELQKHTKRSYLRREFAAIVKKIDPGWPHADRLSNLLNPNTSLDQVFDAVCIPLLLTYDSAVVRAHSRVTDAYVSQFTAELELHHRTFQSKKLPVIRIHLFLVPLRSKHALLNDLDAELRKWQTI